jgi:hypothetical protein
MLAGWECYCRFWRAQKEAKRPNPDLWSFLRDDFHDWRDPAVRNGIVPRLAASVDAYLQGRDRDTAD